MGDLHTVLFCSRYKGAQHRHAVSIGLIGQLRVPLHSPDEPPAGHIHRLGKSVLRICHLTQAMGSPLHSLMMIAVHAQHVLFKKLMQGRAFYYIYPVAHSVIAAAYDDLSERGTPQADPDTDFRQEPHS